MPRLVTSVRVGALVLAALAAGCDHKEKVNSDPARDLWTSSSDQLRGRATELRTRQQALAGRVGALKVPDGTEDAALATQITDLQGQLPALDAACAEVERALAQATAESEVALGKPNKLAAQQIVESKLAAFDGAAATAKSTLDAFVPKLEAAEGLMQRLLDRIAAEVARLDKLAKDGGGADFSDIDFQAGSAQFDFTHPASKATLQRLVAFAGTCDQLRFSVTGHISREGKPAVNKALSLARATAVRDYLVQSGVVADKITKVDGLGSAQTMVDEPTPGTPEEAAMDPAVLEERRRKNRRVTIAVSTSCAPAAAPAVAQPAPGGQPAPTARPPAEAPPR